MKTSGKKSKKPERALRTSLRASRLKLFLGILFFSAGFLFLLSMTPAADSSRVLTMGRQVLNGLAGDTLHGVLPALLLVTAFRLMVSLQHDVSWRSQAIVSGMYFVLLGFLTLITHVSGYGNLMPYIGDIANRGTGVKDPMSYGAYLAFAYRFGAVDLQAQGALGMALAYPVWRLLGPVPGGILLGGLLAVLLFALFRIRLGDLVANLSDTLAEKMHQRRLEKNAERAVPDQEPALAGRYPEEEAQQDDPPRQDPGKMAAAGPVVPPRYQPVPDPVPPYAPAYDPAGEGREEESPRYFPVSVDQVYDEYVQERTDRSARPRSENGRKKSVKTAPAPALDGQEAAAFPSPEEGPGFGMGVPETGASPENAQGTPVFRRPPEETPPFRAAAEPARELSGEPLEREASLPGKRAAAAGTEREPLPWEEPAEGPEEEKEGPGTRTASSEEQEEGRRSPRARRESAAEAPSGDTGAAHSGERQRAAAPAPAWNGLSQSRPADSQRTAQVQYNGAVPVYTDNVMDRPIEREPIGGSRRRQEEPSGSLDGMGRDQKSIMDIDTRSDVVYHYPPIELLSPGIDFNQQDHSQEDRQKAQQIESTLESFNIQAKVMQIMHGPAITRFAIQIAPGIRVQRVTGMADNLALSLATKHVRVEAPIQGTNFIGIEVPNKLISTVSLREVLDSPQMRQNRSPLAVSLGKDIAGTPVICDLGKMPHLLIAGATGSGKSVCIHSIVCSLLFRSSPQQVRLIMIDPKQVELSVYNDVPHLLIPVVTDVRKAAGALGWAVKEMTERYSRFSSEGVRNLDGYNRNHQSDGGKLPNIVIIIDEMADLMDVCRKDVEEYIRRLAALARAAGIYMVLATQRPSVDVITGVIKNNIPSRIAFAVSSGTDSRTILDTFGAEKLMGKGDMLYKPAGISANRVQGSFVSDDEVAAFTEYIKEHSAPEYDSAILDHLSASGQKDSGPDILDSQGMDDDSEGVDSADQLLHEAIQMAIEDGQTSTSMLQRRLRIGYARAGRLVDEMEKRGVVSSQEGSKPRKTLITREQYYEMFSDDPSQEG